MEDTLPAGVPASVVDTVAPVSIGAADALHLGVHSGWTHVVAFPELHLLSRVDVHGDHFTSSLNKSPARSTPLEQAQKAEVHGRSCML